jgi:uncharacterized small protein (DUF1192 family)
MEKLKFGENEFEFVPMGIVEKPYDKVREYSFKSDKNSTELETLLSQPESFAAVQYLAEDGYVLKSYLDCVRLKYVGHNVDTGIYTAVFSTDAVEKKMAEMQAEIEKLKALSNA